MNPQKAKQQKRVRRARRSRGRVRGTAERPRLSVCRSLRHISVQLIDDAQGRTLLALSSLSPEIRDRQPYWGNVEAARTLGQAIGEKATSQGITKVTFDRGPDRYHGRIKALAEAARKAGLQF